MWLHLHHIMKICKYCWGLLFYKSIIRGFKHIDDLENHITVRSLPPRFFCIERKMLRNSNEALRQFRFNPPRLANKIYFFLSFNLPLSKQAHICISEPVISHRMWAFWLSSIPFLISHHCQVVVPRVCRPYNQDGVVKSRTALFKHFQHCRQT